ncbi:MAG: DNA-binding protein Alba [Candidatus Diapherotrites archaeon]|jgi:archaea-specific DNA-binding protein|uniref:DNA/RNA-binding protein Alba n=1 Tax=Candidatus Iainarchaeum sp. TaxID=3101447 RepID=A0A8T5GG81_9ARCH|nr:DNA-binding protein Alba [Candidatus Diapherotrites archaeon]MBT7241284.1 DNA-binding protein Alba [Candidatus Diapherotrites archaeon]
MTKKDESAEDKTTKQEEGYFVYVGKKGVMAYVLAVITQFSEGAKEVRVKARGKSISRAVDVLEIVKSKSEEIKLEAINTSTEEVETDDGRPLKISAIEIVIKK